MVTGGIADYWIIEIRCAYAYVRKDKYAWLTWALAFILVWENKRRVESR